MTFYIIAIVISNTNWVTDPLDGSVNLSEKFVVRGSESPLTGALGGGSPMSHVEYKKWQCPLSLFLQYSCRF